MASCMGLWQLTGLGTRPLFGWLGDVEGLRWLFLIAAMVGLAGVTLWAALERRQPKEPLPS